MPSLVPALSEVESVCVADVPPPSEVDAPADWLVVSDFDAPMSPETKTRLPPMPSVSPSEWLDPCEVETPLPQLSLVPEASELPVVCDWLVPCDSPPPTLAELEEPCESDTPSETVVPLASLVPDDDDHDVPLDCATPWL